ncbi:MAG: hypothetical protein COC06_09875 [Bacteroidales bacterium]|nr:MAG: hypothetical protein COC06_09875 [Bacteroidales bacterium]
MTIKNLLPLGALLMLALTHTCCNPDSKAEKNEETTAKKSYLKKSIVEVEVADVEKGAFPRELVCNGTLTACEKAVVIFKVQEQIENVFVKEGQEVQLGMLLSQLDDFTYEKRLNDAQNNYNKALIDLEDLLLGYGYELADSAKVSGNVMKMCRIRSGINISKSALEEAKRNLAYTKVVAPVSGVVCNLEAKKNNPSSQYKKCCEILDNSRMLVEFHILEGEISMVGEGQKVEVFPYALPDIKKFGAIKAVNPVVADGLIKITAEIPNNDGVLLDGMNVKILLKSEIPDCIIIPKSAVLYRQNRKVVFVHKDSLAFWTYVETGLENSSEVVITDGSLKPGEKVIVSNNLNLAHESPVKLVDGH